MDRASTAAIAGVLCACSVLPACSSEDPKVASTVTATATVTVTQSPPATSDPPPIDEGPTSVGPTPSEPPPPNTDLTTADAFKLDGNWTDDRYNIATRKQQKGMGVEVRTCSPDGGYAPSMEVRLENGFTGLAFEAGQANTSESSDQVLKVEVIGDGKQLEIRQIAFNRVQQFKEVNVSGVNALSFVLYLDDSVEDCGSGTVLAVLSGMKLT